MVDRTMIYLDDKQGKHFAAIYKRLICTYFSTLPPLLPQAGYASRSAKMCEVTHEKHFTSTNLFADCELRNYTLALGFNPFFQL